MLKTSSARKDLAEEVQRRVYLWKHFHAVVVKCFHRGGVPLCVRMYAYAKSLAEKINPAPSFAKKLGAG